VFPDKVFENLIRKPHGNPEKIIRFYLKSFSGFHLTRHFMPVAFLDAVETFPRVCRRRAFRMPAELLANQNGVWME
jgi:hypothetical protein